MKLENVVFVRVAQVEKIHEEALASGGAAGILDLNLLVSAVLAPSTTFDGRPLYGSLAEMAATYAWSIARNHAFVDGNKRTALMTALTFLELNGRKLQVGPEWVDVMVRVASDEGFPRSALAGEFVRAMGTDVPID